MGTGWKRLVSLPNSSRESGFFSVEVQIFCFFFPFTGFQCQCALLGIGHRKLNPSFEI